MRIWIFIILDCAIHIFGLSAQAQLPNSGPERKSGKRVMFGGITRLEPG